MKENLIKTINLENDMQVCFYDGSRKLAGDRWMVSLVVRMEIPVSQAMVLDDGESTDINDIRHLLGETVLFEQKRDRIFVDDKEKESVLEELFERFQENALHYLANPLFPEKYVRKLYKEEKKKQSLYPEASE